MLEEVRVPDDMPVRGGEHESALLWGPLVHLAFEAHGLNVAAEGLQQGRGCLHASTFAILAGFDTGPPCH
jgi:hypothetical protein